ncbi:MarR family transcriptional regulator [Salinisphaera hydrothermalis]
MISSGGVTSRVDRLEKAGLVRRRRSPKDRRSVQVELTTKGLAKIDAILEWSQRDCSKASGPRHRDMEKPGFSRFLLGADP